MIAQAQAAKERQGLQEAADIITAATADRGAVRDSDFHSATDIGFQVKAEPEAEARASSADSEVMRGAEGPPAVQSEAVRAPLTRENLAAFLGENRESDKLSKYEDVSELDPQSGEEQVIVGVTVFCMALYLRHRQSTEAT
jgi:hypothetical protein